MFGSGGGEGEGGWDQWGWGIKSNRWAEVVVLAGGTGGLICFFSFSWGVFICNKSNGIWGDCVAG